MIDSFAFSVYDHRAKHQKEKQLIKEPQSRIILIRHAKSAGNEDEKNYTKPGGDITVPLVSEGWMQAFKAGQYVDQHRQKNNITKPLIYTSGYIRTQETTSGILSEITDSSFLENLTLKHDIRLSEQSFGALSYFVRDLKEEQTDNFVRLFKGYSEEIYKKMPYKARTPLGESPADIFTPIATFFENKVYPAIQNGHRDIYIVLHGNSMKNAWMFLFDIPISEWTKLDTPENCDIFEVIGTPNNWSKITQIWNGKAGIAVNKNPLENVQFINPSTLPKVPTHLKIN